MKNWYYDLPIKSKLNLANIMIIVIPMLVLAFMANKISSDILIEKSMSNSIQSFNVITSGIDSLLNQVEYLSKLTVNNNNVQKVIKLSKEEIAKQTESRYDVIRSLDNMVADKDIISTAILYTRKGIILSSTNVVSGNIAIDDASLESFSKSAMEGKGRIFWRNTQPIPYYLTKKSLDCVSLFRALIDGDSAETMGVLEIDIDQSIIARLFSSQDKSKLTQTIIVDEEGMIVSSSDPARLYEKIDGEGYFRWVMDNSEQGKVFTVGDNRYLITSVKYDRLGWYVIGFIPVDNLTRDNSRVTYLIFFVCLLCIILAALSSILNSMAITRPIISLSHDMWNAGKGDMEVRAVVSGNDEIGILSRSFNNMIQRISDLMDKVYGEQKMKKEFELQALQAQINPHFLYNTLENVCSLAMKQRNDDVILMVKSLARFYRSALSKGRNVIAIREEIDNIRQYLIIQKIRYGDKFDYTIELDEALMDKPVVKLTLQPLVENAIYHGIKQKPGTGSIQITGRVAENEIIISVADDGVGFDAGDQSRLFDDSGLQQDKKSYGLSNVNQRIKLYFGPEYGLAITSRPGDGTRVDVILPAVEFDS